MRQYVVGGVLSVILLDAEDGSEYVAGTTIINSTSVSVGSPYTLSALPGALALSGLNVTLTYALPGGIWDYNFPNDWDTVYSNGNRTASVGAGDGLYSISVTGHTAGGSALVYAEITINTYTGSSSSSERIYVADGTDTYAVQLFADGDLHTYSASFGTHAHLVWGAGSVIGIAFKASTKEAWFRVNSGAWNAGGTANPATGVGGVFIGATVLPVYIRADNDYSAATAVTINTGTHTFANTPPSGYLSWYGTAAPGYTLTALPGAIALSGLNVNLNKTTAVTHYKLEALPGAFTLSGQSVTLRTARKMQAGAGAFALSGQSVNLRVARKMQASVGAFTLSGQTVTLRYAYKMQAGAGAIVLSGKSVNLRYSGEGHMLSALTGAFVLSGKDVNLRRTHKLASTTGNIVLSGKQVDLTKSTSLAGMKIWTGSAWIEKPTKVWSGSVWAIKPVKTWNGTTWV